MNRYKWDCINQSLFYSYYEFIGMSEKEVRDRLSGKTKKRPPIVYTRSLELFNPNDYSGDYIIYSIWDNKYYDKNYNEVIG